MVRPKHFWVFTGCVCGAHRSLAVLEAFSDDEFLANCHIFPAKVGHRCNEIAQVDLVLRICDVFGPLLGDRCTSSELELPLLVRSPPLMEDSQH